MAQAGKQFEYLTAGHVLAGYHEVCQRAWLPLAATVAAALLTVAIDSRQLAAQIPWDDVVGALGQRCGFDDPIPCPSLGAQVVVTPDTVAAVAKARDAGRSLWRVSSTCFYHINSDVVLQPIGPFAALESAAAYPAIDSGEQVRKELELIKLGAVSTH